MSTWHERLEVMAKAKGLNLDQLYSLVRDSDVDVYREYRRLRHDLRLANKERGKQGETIHQLRAEVALYRSMAKAVAKEVEYYQTVAKAPALTGEVGQKFEQIPPSQIEGLA